MINQEDIEILDFDPKIQSDPYREIRVKYIFHILTIDVAKVVT